MNLSLLMSLYNAGVRPVRDGRSTRTELGARFTMLSLATPTPSLVVYMWTDPTIYVVDVL